MNVFITGASGFLGRFLSKELQEAGVQITALSSKDADLTKQNSLRLFNNHMKYDRIFHLATWTQAGYFSLYNPGKQWLINQQMNTHILEWWLNEQHQAKLISIGTSCSYADGMPLIEENYLKGEPLEDLFTYAMTKRMLLIGQKSLNKQFGLKYLTVIPSTLYGPHYFSNGKQPHFIFDLIKKILNYKYNKTDIVVWGDGNQKRELIYIDDFVKALLALDRILENDLVNIGAGEEHTIREFAEMICEIIDVKASVITYDTKKYVGAKEKHLSNDKIDKILPNRQRTPLKKGLGLTIKWMENYYFINQAEK
ncbi:MAG: NAD-dependent epimerase/dehydratase family protein [Deltaproteobacteria bacterium]|nr:NAD-dependent epimerase/dehydratase family protein [Deltaproteobacteria bacterium]